MRPGWKTAVTSKRVRALLACGVLLGTGAIGTSALWSTTSQTLSGTFTTGVLKIEANGSHTATLTFPGTLLPAYTTAAMVDVQNVGSVALTYVPSVQATGTSGTPPTDVGRWTTLKSTVVAANATVGSASTGTVCPSGSATLVSAQNVSTAKTEFTGVPPRPLAVGSSERLCMQLTLRTDTPAQYAGLNLGSAGSVVFFFDATG